MPDISNNYNESPQEPDYKSLYNEAITSRYYILGQSAAKFIDGILPPGSVRKRTLTYIKRKLSDRRMRSKKKSILFIDDHIPRFDTNAGERMIFQVISLAREANIEVAFVGSDAVWDEYYGNQMSNIGVELVGFPNAPDARYSDIAHFLADNGANIDYVYICRPGNASRYLPLIEQYTNAIKIYNLVDLHYLRMQREHALGVSVVSHDDIVRVKAQENEIIQRVDIALTPSFEERDYIRGELENVKVAAFPLFAYRKLIPINKNFNSRKDMLFVGGFKHAPNADAVLWFCGEILPAVCRELPNIRLHIVGADIPPEIQGIGNQNQNVVIHGYLNDQDLSELYRSCRIVVVPLRYGAGVKGKTIEAMFWGVPVVSTRIGIEGIQDAASYINVADDAPSFAKTVVNLYQNPELLSYRSSRCRAYVKKHFSIKTAKRFYRKLFDGGRVQ